MPDPMPIPTKTAILLAQKLDAIALSVEDSRLILAALESAPSGVSREQVLRVINEWHAKPIEDTHSDYEDEVEELRGLIDALFSAPASEPTILEKISELADSLPEEVIAGIPTDGASQLDHYVYGTPKRPVAASEPPAPSEGVDWPTEPGLWLRLGGAAEPWSARRDIESTEIVVRNVYGVTWYTSDELPRSAGWRRLPSAAESARIAELERHVESAERAIFNDEAELLKLQAQLAASQAECERLKAERQEWYEAAQVEQSNLSPHALRHTLMGAREAINKRDKRLVELSVQLAVASRWERKANEVLARLRALRRYVAIEGHNDDDAEGPGCKLIGLAYDASVWGPCYNPSYDPMELLENIEKWLHSKLDELITMLAQPAGEQAAAPEKCGTCPNCGTDEMEPSGKWACNCDELHEDARVAKATCAATLQLIAEERERQILKEGWSLLHDNHHSDGSLASAAACYADDRQLLVKVENSRGIGFADAWPWDSRWDKRKKHDRRRRLVIAGALIVAEIERINRADLAAAKGDGG